MKFFSRILFLTGLSGMGILGRGFLPVLILLLGISCPSETRKDPDPKDPPRVLILERENFEDEGVSKQK